MELRQGHPGLVRNCSLDHEWSMPQKRGLADWFRPKLLQLFLQDPVRQTFLQGVDFQKNQAEQVIGGMVTQR